MASTERLGGARPPVTVEVFHTWHETVTDMQGFPQFADRIDLYMPEMPGWTPGHLDEYRVLTRGGVSKNVIKAAPHLTGSTRLEHLTLHGTKKPVTIVDFPAGYKADNIRITDKFHSMTALANQIINSPGFDEPIDFDEIMERAESMLRRKSDTNKEREDHMVAEFDPAVILAIESSARLQRLDTVRIGMKLGLYHTRVPNELRSNGHSVEQTFANEHPVYPHNMLAEQAILLEKPLDRTLLAQAVLTGIVYKIIEPYSHGDDTNKQAAMIYNVVSAFTYDEIQTFIEGYLQNGNPEQYQEYFENAFLEAKGIQIPRSERQLLKFLHLDDTTLNDKPPRPGSKRRRPTGNRRRRR